MKRIRLEDTFTKIYGWMATELGLTGLDLLVYASIYSFCQGNASLCTASYKTIADKIGVGESTVRCRIVPRLKKLGLIEEGKKIGRNVSFTTNRFQVLPVKEFKAIKPTNTFTIEYWMANNLGLSDTNLLVYAMIYSFTNTENDESRFVASVDYMKELSGTCGRSIKNALNYLLEQELIFEDYVGYYHNESKLSFLDNKNEEKRSILPNLNENDSVLEKSSGIMEILSAILEKMSGIEEKFSANTKETKETKVITEELSDVPVEANENPSDLDDVLSYYNTKCHKNYKSSHKTVAGRITKLLETHTVDDIKAVIDLKWHVWGENPKVFSDGTFSFELLKPSFLFGKNFEKYLREANNHKTVTLTVLHDDDYYRQKQALYDKCFEGNNYSEKLKAFTTLYPSYDFANLTVKDAVEIFNEENYIKNGRTINNEELKDVLNLINIYGIDKFVEALRESEINKKFSRAYINTVLFNQK